MKIALLTIFTMLSLSVQSQVVMSDKMYNAIINRGRNLENVVDTLTSVVSLHERKDSIQDIIIIEQYNQIESISEREAISERKHKREKFWLKVVIGIAAALSLIR